MSALIRHSETSSRASRRCAPIPRPSGHRALSPALWARARQGVGARGRDEGPSLLHATDHAPRLDLLHADRVDGHDARNELGVDGPTRCAGCCATRRLGRRTWTSTGRSSAERSSSSASSTSGSRSTGCSTHPYSRPAISRARGQRRPDDESRVEGHRTDPRGLHGGPAARSIQSRPLDATLSHRRASDVDDDDGFHRTMTTLRGAAVHNTRLLSIASAIAGPLCRGVRTERRHAHAAGAELRHRRRLRGGADQRHHHRRHRQCAENRSDDRDSREPHRRGRSSRERARTRRRAT